MRIGYINLKISLLIIFIFDFPFIIEYITNDYFIAKYRKNEKTAFLRYK